MNAMMDSKILKLALVQTTLYWKDKVANFAMLEEKIWDLDQDIDLVVLPEMFSTGFTMDVAEMAEPMNHTACKWMKQMAAQKQMVLTGSVIIQEEGRFYNRMLWVEPSGKIQWYDKRHLFRMADEDASFDMGFNRVVFELNGWKILPQVCYDLRFPVWSRNRVIGEEMEYDLCIYVASWPAPRISAWDILLQARAVENLSYSVGVNRIGKDGHGVPFSGHTSAYDFKGNQLVFNENEEEILVVELNKQDLSSFRRKFPAWKDADDFQING